MPISKLYYQDINRASETCGEILEESLPSSCIPTPCPPEDLEEFYFFITSVWDYIGNKAITFEWKHGFEWDQCFDFYYSFSNEGQKYPIGKEFQKPVFIQWFTEETDIYFWASVKAHDLDEAYRLFWDNYNNNYLNYRTHLDDDNKLYFYLTNEVRGNLEFSKTVLDQTLNKLYTDSEVSNYPIPAQDISQSEAIIQLDITSGSRYYLYSLYPNTTRYLLDWMKNQDWTVAAAFLNVPVESPVFVKDWIDNYMADKDIDIYKDPANDQVVAVLKYNTYDKAKYLQSDGLQWINTGVIPNRNQVWEFDWEVTEQSANQQCVGAQKFVSGASTGFRYLFTNGNCSVRFGNSNVLFGSVGTSRHTTKMDFVNDTEQVGRYTKTGLASTADLGPYPFHLFAMAQFNTESEPKLPTKMKFYSGKIWENGELIRNYIPVFHKERQEYCLFDTVEKKFYFNESETGQFTGEKV